MHIHWAKTLDTFENQRCSSWNMCILTWLLIFAFWSILRPFFKLEHPNLVQLEHLIDFNFADYMTHFLAMFTKKASFSHWIKKCFVNWSLICDAHSLGQDLGHFRKTASQFIKYAHIYQMTNFHIMVIPEAIFIWSQYWNQRVLLQNVPTWWFTDRLAHAQHATFLVPNHQPEYYSQSICVVINA